MIRPRALVLSFVRDTRAVSAVEFAICLPILLTLYLGGYSLSDAIACNRKVTTATRTVADLTTQYSILSDSGIVSILNAATQVMAPYPSANAQIRVSQLYTDANGVTTVVWSHGINGAGDRPLNAPYTLPGAIANKSTYLILAEITYTYVPAASFAGFGAQRFSDAIYMSPRLSNSVTDTPS